MSSWLNMLFGLESLAPSRGSHVITRAGVFSVKTPQKEDVLGAVPTHVLFEAQRRLNQHTCAFQGCVKL